MSIESYQTLCVTKSEGYAVQGTPDCQKPSKSHIQCQLEQLYSANNCAKVPLVDGGFALVDIADLPLVEGYRWYRISAPRTYYARSHKACDMHRLILGLQKGDGAKVDHRNHNGLDNRRENLRVGTQSQNLFNQRKRLRPSKFPFKGVSSIGNRFKAEIGFQRKRLYLGTFATAEDAARAYNEKALILFGDRACLNPLPHPADRRAA